MSNTLFTKAEDFIWKNARLLERRLFAYHFKEGAREDVITALCAYQNADGGFGQAFEPDIRCPDSQPVPVQHALEVLDTVGIQTDEDAEMVERICDYLMTITTKEGGVPWLLPSALNYPRAPWWQTEDNPPASLNPTAAIAGLLHKNQIDHPWLEPATQFCWTNIETMEAREMHEVGTVLTFLYHAPDRPRAERERHRLFESMLSAGLVAGLDDTAYVRKPLDWASTPDNPLRKYFSQEQIEANLDVVVAGQQDDGGWTIAWAPISPCCELEWRGVVTLATLLTLRANGRLTTPSIP
ncbi:MAG: hypothetical protein AAF639_23645 [Chloroflexota bacterium]